MTPFLPALIALTAIQRIFELRLSSKNIRILEKTTRKGGGILWPGDGCYWFGALVLVQVGLLVAPLVEASFIARPVPLLQSIVAIGLWLAGQGLRLWSQKSLGTLWNARGIVSSNQRIVLSGPYKYFRHPNYFGVILEMIAIPLAGSAWYSLLTLNFLLAPLLHHRIYGEERLLSRLEHFSELPGKPLHK